MGAANGWGPVVASLGTDDLDRGRGGADTTLLRGFESCEDILL